MYCYQENAKSKIKTLLSTVDVDQTREIPEDDEEEYITEDDFIQNSVIYRDSNFWQLYSTMADNIYKKNNVRAAVNKYYNRSFLNDLLKKYIAFLPLSSSFVLNSRDSLKRANNGPIERYFGITKFIIKSQRKVLGTFLYLISSVWLMRIMNNTRVLMD